ncbi:MAG: L-threonylcarbamoyladenylate synthase [Bacillota bacterium]|nr:L-threonylcarbamoyladenylate synthase [Bacillota bacterium]
MKKNTIIIRENRIDEASRALREGKLVVFPTETVYGLGANVYDEEAVKNIFVAKGRPSDNPLIVHISDIDQLRDLVREIPEYAQSLIDAFWPGPLTLVMKKSDLIPEIITGGLDTVAIRMPNNPVALKLINLSGVPIAAPSANISGRPSPTSEIHVIEDLGGRVDYIILGGDTSVGLESTVLDISGKTPRILRPGHITYEDIREIIGRLKYDSHLTDENITPKSPGMKYRHYSPEAKVIIVEGRYIRRKMLSMIDDYADQGIKVGVMGTDELLKDFKDVVCCSLGDTKKISVVGNRLFRCLRDLDRQKVDVILAESFDREGLGVAIMNRLEKAAGYHIINSEEDI